VWLSIILACIAAYLPAINNSFISDDFTLLSFLQALKQNPGAIWNAVSELFRVVSYVYFAALFKLFGLRPALYYMASIALHCTVSLLVFAMVRAVTGRRLTAWVAAIFFAVYARHEEAVMWISANNSTILTLNCLAFLCVWELHLSAKRRAYAVALAIFTIALFSKENAVFLLPMAALRMRMRHYPAAEIGRRTWPLVAIFAGYVLFWLSQANRNFFVADGHYAVTTHFFSVYARSLLSLLSSALPFIAALMLLIYRRKRTQHGSQISFDTFRSDFGGSFFVAWILLPLVPVSFLTYAKYIASRNTYLPSVALAALIGILFTMLLDNTTSLRGRNACCLFLAGALAWNMVYLWRKQDPEYVKRAAPTRELIALLNTTDVQAFKGSIEVCGFPLHPSIGSAAVAIFTNVNAGNVRFPGECNETADVVLARWDETNRVYVTQSRRNWGQ